MPDLNSAASHDAYDAVVVGSGPNGLAAAITLSRQGHSVLVFEAAETVGGGMRSAELTQPGLIHDICSTVQALAIESPLFREWPLSEWGLEWVFPPAPCAHPLDGGLAAVLERSVDDTAVSLGPDAGAYRRLLTPLVRDGDRILDQALSPLKMPRHPLPMLRFGLAAVRSARGLAGRFQGEAAGALWAGLAAHAVLPLERIVTSAPGMVLAMAAHRHGWPLVRGGSQQLADALARYFLSLGGEIAVRRPVNSMGDLPGFRVALFDPAPRDLVRIAGDLLPPRYQRAVRRFRYGPAVFKLDWALDGPIPWQAAECRRAGTVHVGGTFEEIAAALRAAWENRPTERPFLIVAQQSLFDPTRAPPGKQTAWGYCHVPHGSNQDMVAPMERQIERFAPGFRDRILQRHIFTPADFQRYNPNYVGGDISGGAMDLWQLFTRPVARIVPYATPHPRLFLCSSSTPPGGGVHGLCSYYAAQAAATALRNPRLREPLRLRIPTQFS